MRQAIKELENQRRLTTEKGKGTFVARPKIVEGFVQRLSGFHEDMAARGFRVTTRIVRQELVASVYVSTYVPQEICPALLRADLENKSLCAFLEGECGLQIHKGHRYIAGEPGERGGGVAAESGGWLSADRAGQRELPEGRAAA